MGTGVEDTSIRAVITLPERGTCIMSGFPGLATAVDGSAYIDPESADTTLRAIRKAGAALLIVLTEETELPEQAYCFLRQQAEASGIALEFLPIPDFQAPDARGLAQWEALKSARPDLPDAGGTVAFACQYGAGRSGLMAALLHLEQGASLDQAVSAVRSHFGEAIESEVQMAWLTEMAARAKTGFQPG